MSDPIKQAMELVAEASELPDPNRTLLSHNERELVTFCLRMADALEALSALQQVQQAAPAVPEGDLISRAEVLRVCSVLGKQSADLALYGDAENARSREAMEAAATRLRCAVALIPTAERATPLSQTEESPWQPTEAAPVNTPVLVYWPAVELDDEGAPTCTPTGDGFVGVAERVGGYWSEPDTLNAVGASFGDDWAYAPEPTHFMPLPPPPSDHPADVEHTTGNGSGSPTLQQALEDVRRYGEQYGKQQED